MIFSPQSRRFWLLTFAALLMAGVTFSLGHWQLRRAAQKEAVQAEIQAKNTLPTLDTWALAATNNIANELHRKASVVGVWQPAHTVYLDNRPMGGRTGFWVLTPLALQGGNRVVLVQRGWAPRDFNDRTRLPQVFTPVGPVAVEGRIAPPPAKLYAFKGVDSGSIRQNLDLDDFRTETGLPLMEAALLQTGPPGDGLLRDWVPANQGVDKHYGYAFQWFSLCALVVGLYAWFQLALPFRIHLRARRRDPIDTMP